MDLDVVDIADSIMSKNGWMPMWSPHLLYEVITEILLRFSVNIYCALLQKNYLGLALQS